MSKKNIINLKWEYKNHKNEKNLCYISLSIEADEVDDYLKKNIVPQFEVKHKYLRYMHTDVLWFLKSPNRFKCKPSWFSFKNTTDQIFSWSDLWVFFAFTLQGFAKLSKDKKKRNL